MRSWINKIYSEGSVKLVHIIILHGYPYKIWEKKTREIENK